MKTITGILPLICSIVACGGSEEKRFFDPRPLDGPYRVTVTQKSNTCGHSTPDPDARPFVDMLLRDDGLYDLRHGSLDIPGEFEVHGIVHDDGNIAHDESWTSQSGTDYRIRIDGTLTPDKMDLLFRFDGYPKCRIERYVRGDPWPLRDPESLEGLYTITETPTGNTCDGANRQFGTPWTTVMTSVVSSGAGFWLSSPDGWKINPDVPDDDGTLDWRGSLLLNMGFTTMSLDATLRGIFGPADVSAILSYWVLGTSPETTTCTEEQSLVGAKRLPSLDTLDNDYRGRYAVHDGCDARADEQDSTLDATARLVTQPNGSVILVDPFTSMALELRDGSLHGRIGSPPERGMLTIDGNVSSSLLSYTITYDRFGADGLWQCSTTVEATDMHVRYVFE